MEMKKFHALAWQKLVENCLSLKAQVIFGYMALTFYLTMIDKMPATVFAETNAAVIGTVLAIREGIKVVRIKANGKDDKNGSGEGSKEPAKFQV